jgi:hypothetical protein
MTRIRDALAALGSVVLFVWVLAVAGAFSAPGTVDWVLFGIGVGVLAASRFLRGGDAGPAQRPL